jgi:hypothetical protein
MARDGKAARSYWLPTRLIDILDRIRDLPRGQKMSTDKLIRASIDAADAQVLASIDKFPARPRENSDKVGATLPNHLKSKVETISDERSKAKKSFDTLQSVVEECVARYLYANRKRWNLTPEELAATGYSEQQPPSEQAK